MFVPQPDPAITSMRTLYSRKRGSLFPLKSRACSKNAHLSAGTYKPGTCSGIKLSMGVHHMQSQ
jgi:hypothetical protein